MGFLLSDEVLERVWYQSREWPQEWRTTWLKDAMRLSGQTIFLGGHGVLASYDLIRELIPDHAQRQAFIEGNQEEFYK